MRPVVDFPTTQSSQESRPAASSSRFTGKHIHFIGIGGSGMSGLARMLLDHGAILTGSEPKPNAPSLDLAKRGVRISRDQIGQLLSKDIDLVVRTAAVPDSNPEFQTALRLGIPTIKYAQLLGQIMAERLGIAVAGTHGKSTTTAMISYALLTLNADPSFVIGGTVPQLGGGSRSGMGRPFVAEACEFDRSFHNLQPTVAIITNVEADHLDCYKDLDDIIASFRHFASLLPPTGRIITLADDANALKAISGLPVEIELCALADTSSHELASSRNITWFTRITGIKNGCHTGDIYYNSEHAASIELSVPGRHNLINATMAVAACVAAGQDPQAAATAVGSFTGVDRRMTYIGTCNGATVLDDYGHHPTEILATLRALRERYNPARLFCVFQPHQASRTRLLLNDFGTAFKDADEILIPDIYFVRDSEADKQAIHATDLVAAITANQKHARHLPDFTEILATLKRELKPGDLIVTLGAGTIWEVARDLVT
ncbi:MAG TPA: UDP-N-acetylmuramate--L-alanine ligase [Tepidisphaeraceae bacterium]|jgi:UDP-N-acetylmuramate--alanine ligase|nr:UDP-N-acetylmuramate--L-alanine ligase [Tepidisphaeraceae bacterium]